MHERAELFLRLLHSFFEQFFHRGDGFRVFGIVGDVFVFLWVFCEIVEHLGFAVVVAGVAELIGDDGIGIHETAVGSFVEGLFWIVEQRGEIAALHGGGRGDAGERAQAREEVGGFDEACGDTWFFAGHSDDERHAGGEVHCVVFAPEIVLAEVPTVVAPEHDDGSVRKAESIEFGEDIAGEFVGVAGAGEVAVAHGAMELVGVGVHVREVIAAELAAALELFGCLGGALAVGGELDRIALIEVPVFFRRVEGHVGFEKSAGEKKRLPFLLETLQIFDGFFCCLAIGIDIVGHFGQFVDAPALFGFGESTRRLRVMAAHVVARLPRRLAPAAVGGIFFVVIDLSVRNRGVTGLAEHLRQGRGGGDIHVHAAIADEALGGRQHPGHQRGARAHADRHLAIRSIKTQAAGGKFVDVRRLDLRHSITSKLGAQVIDGDE